MRQKNLYDMINTIMMYASDGIVEECSIIVINARAKLFVGFSQVYNRRADIQ